MDGPWGRRRIGREGKEEDKREAEEEKGGGRGKKEGRSGKRRSGKEREVSLKSVPMGLAGQQVSARGPAVAKDRPG